MKKCNHKIKIHSIYQKTKKFFFLKNFDRKGKLILQLQFNINLPLSALSQSKSI